MLIAYDSDGNVVASLDNVVVSDTDGKLLGTVDLAAHEAADLWKVDGATGSAVWPDKIPGSAHDYRVKLKAKRIIALEHKVTGKRLDRGKPEG